ncbi:MAG: acyl-CoA dehydrogenase family protein [Acidimicrobiales bacterium]
MAPRPTGHRSTTPPSDDTPGGTDAAGARPDPAPEVAKIVERVRALGPTIAERAGEAEARRQPVDEVVEALAGTGVFRCLVPRRFGGFEIDNDTFIDIGMSVGEADTSTGWITTFYTEHNWMFAQFPPEAQEEIFGTQPYILAPASISPTGRATVDGNGYQLTGRWSWATGVMHADWVMLNGIVEGDVPEPRLFIAPVDAITVDEVWDAAGMAGTGSNDMVAENLFIPAHRSQALADMAVGRSSGAAWLDSPVYRQPMMPFLAMTAAIPALGAARRAVDLFRQRLGTRSIYGTFAAQAERGSAQMRLAHASVRAEEAEILLRAVGRELNAWGREEEPCPVEHRARLRLRIAHVVEQCRDVVRTIMEASGAGAHLRSNPMQRIHRDVHTLSCHTVFDLDIGSENYGRVLLGLDPVAAT